MFRLERFEKRIGHKAEAVPDGFRAICDCRFHQAVTAKDLDALADMIYGLHKMIACAKQRYLCGNCGKQRPLDPHHRIRRSRGRDDRVANLIMLCRECHDFIERNPRLTMVQTHSASGVFSMYTQQKDGEWVQPIRRGYKMQCCDCGLVHRIDFRIREGNVQFRAYRDNRCTGQVRRRRGIAVKH